MAQVLKVEEWQSASKRWHVADTHTWTNWRAMAEVLDVDFEGFKELLINKYGATIDGFIEYEDKASLLLFSFKEYKGAHQLKLDVNRIARKKNYMVERSF